MSTLDTLSTQDLRDVSKMCRQVSRRFLIYLQQELTPEANNTPISLCHPPSTMPGHAKSQEEKSVAFTKVHNDLISCVAHARVMQPQHNSQPTAQGNNTAPPHCPHCPHPPTWQQNHWTWSHPPAHPTHYLCCPHTTSSLLVMFAHR
jgi:hypothetical protein